MQSPQNTFVCKKNLDMFLDKSHRGLTLICLLFCTTEKHNKYSREFFGGQHRISMTRYFDSLVAFLDASINNINRKEIENYVNHFVEKLTNIMRIIS